MFPINKKVELLPEMTTQRITEKIFFRGYLNFKEQTHFRGEPNFRVQTYFKGQIYFRGQTHIRGEPYFRVQYKHISARGQ